MRAAVAIFSMLATSWAVAGEPTSGKALFEQFCSQCHAAGYGHPGTQQLGWRRGQDHAVLELRKDLVPAYIMSVVRNGLVEMPPFRPTEIDDASLRLIVRYLVQPKATAHATQVTGKP